jgi:hypothetical protein
VKSAKIDVSNAASQTQILKPIHSKAIVSRLDFYLTVMCTMTSYAAADCHFRHDAHRRMASVIACTRCAEERERGDRASDHQTVNGEKLFMSVTSAECTEFEYAAERYSESPPPDGTKTNKCDTATRKRRRGFAPRIQVELDSSSDEAPTCPGPHRRRMLPAKITRHKVYFQRTFLTHFRALLHSRLKRHSPTVATLHWTCCKFPRYRRGPRLLQRHQ